MKETKMLGIRYYGPEEMKTYNQVKNIANENKLNMSKTGKLLINRGLHHTDNLEPLVKEKIVYKDRVVYKDKPGTDKHTENEHIGVDQETEQHPSDSKLMSRDKAGLPLYALDKKEAVTNGSKKTNWGGGLAITGLIGLAGYLLWCAVTK